MSGGVDSSTAAALLVREGYEVIGVTMRLWTVEQPELPLHHRRCCSVEDIDDARSVCQHLGIPHYVLSFEREFGAQVVDYFVAEYGRGRTPNPCLACNQHVKFRPLLAKARALGADHLATGHYARIVRNGHYELWRARDPRKDQSYVLYMLGQEELSHTLFPLGEYTKEEVRELARSLDLPVADKPDSEEVCFVTQPDYRSFLAERLPQKPGEIVDRRGHVLGYHSGISGFTIGQRHGLGIAQGVPLYVTSIDAEHNRVVVGGREELYRTSLWAEELHFVAGPPEGAIMVEAKVRYRSPATPARLKLEGGRAQVRFLEPQRAVAPGQAVVFYQGEKVLGGGIIGGAISENGTRGNEV